jgi:flagellar hook-associated protein 2
MAGIQMSGLASGLDTASLVAQLMQVERIPRSRVERTQAAVQARQDVLKDIQTRLKALKTATADLQSSALWSPSRTTTSSDAARVGARATGAAFTPGTYDVEVTRLATTAQERWTTQTRPISSDLTFTSTASGSQVVVNVAANSSVDQIVAAINAKTGVPVVATNDNGVLKLDAKVMGAPGEFSVTGFSLDSQQSEIVGVDAAFTVNGAAHTSTNNLSSTAIAGVELDLKGLTAAGTPVTITATETPADKAAIGTKLKAFVEAYNNVVDFVRGKIAEKGDPKAATLTEAKKGVLYGDSGLSQILGTLRNGLMNPLAGNAETQDEMHEIGLSTGGAVSVISPDRVSGKLSFDEAKFNKAWDADKASVERLLRGDGTPTGTGFTQRMDALIKPMIEAGGLLDGRINGAGSELKAIASRLAHIDKRLERKEEAYKRQFTALETALAKSQSIQSQLAGQLAGLPNFSGK